MTTAKHANARSPFFANPKRLLCVVAVASSLVLAACTAPVSTPPGLESNVGDVHEAQEVDEHSGVEPMSAYGVRERFDFDTAEEMAETADVIAAGTIKAVEQGRSVGDPGGTADFLNVVVSVDRLLKGSPSGDSITFEFLAFPRIGDLRGFPPFEPDSPWWQPGSTSLFFLRSTRSGELQVINSQSVYYMPDGPDGVLESTKAGDDVVAEIAGDTLSDFSATVLAP